MCKTQNVPEKMRRCLSIGLLKIRGKSLLDVSITVCTLNKKCRRTHNSEYYIVNTLKREKRRMEGSEMPVHAIL